MAVCTHTFISSFFLMLLALCTTEPYASDLCSKSKYYSYTDITSLADITMGRPDGGSWLNPATLDMTLHQEELVPLRPGLKKGTFSYFFSGIQDLIFGRDHPVSWSGVKLIALDPSFAPYFFSVWLPKIKSPFILVTAGDPGMPHESFSSKGSNLTCILSRRKLNLQKLLDNPNIVAWYIMNYDGSIGHDKLRPIPIGMRRKQCENLDDLIAKMPEIKDRKFMVYSDTHLNNTSARNGYNLSSRAEIYEQIKDNPLVEHQEVRIRRWKQFENRTNYVFSLSLVGRGMDCHRTWESLNLGNIVLLQSSPLDHLFEGLPVVIIKDWSEINEANLKKWAAKYHDATTNPKYREKLTSAYWLKMVEADIQSVEKKSRPSKCQI